MAPPTSAPAGPSAPRGTMNERRWNEVLEAAAATFVEKGYQAARMEDVADRLGILKGSLYYYVTSKEDLLDELIRRTNRSGLAVVASLDELDGDAPSRLRTFVERWVQHVERHDHVAPLVHGGLHHLPPDRQAQVRRERSHMERAVRDLIRRGVDEGSFAPETDPALTAKSLFVVLNATGTWRRRGRLRTSEISDHVIRLFLDGMLTRARD